MHPCMKVRIFESIDPTYLNILVKALAVAFNVQ